MPPSLTKPPQREIKALVAIYKQTGNMAYLRAAENGIKYLLNAQNAVGGWGQFYPDTSGYHKHITYNDNAMIDVLWIMKYISEGTSNFETINEALIPPAKAAMTRGIGCMLKAICPKRQTHRLVVLA
ncbi:MAG: pectate lyase [Spirosomataceae bacterium]